MDFRSSSLALPLLYAQQKTTVSQVQSLFNPYLNHIHPIYNPYLLRYGLYMAYIWLIYGLYMGYTPLYPAVSR